MSRTFRLSAGLVVITAASLLAYLPAMKAGYVWDDDDYVTENTLLSAPDGLYRIWFTTDSPSQYFPMVYTTFRLEYSLWGLNPFGYHFSNILLHIINALLLFWLLSKLNVPAAWFASAIFALHPVHVESVAWITERKNVLMAFFFFLSLLSYLRFAEHSHHSRNTWFFYFLSLFLCALSLLSKTTACTLPAALVLLLWLKKIPLNKKRWLQIAPYILLSLAMGLLTMWWEQHHQGTGWTKIDLNPLERILIASRAFWFYLAKLLWPAKLAFSYPKWNIDTAALLQYLWPLACIAVAWCLWHWRNKIGRGAIAAVIFFAATLLPMLGFISLYTFVYTYVADHYQYVASIGPIALFASLTCLALPRFGKYQKPISKIAPAVILIILAALTFRQCRAYENLETLWLDTLRKNPNSLMAHNNLGAEYQVKGSLDKAVHHYIEALRIDPESEKAHYNLGLILESKGNLDLAVNHYTAAVNIAPTYDKAHFNLAKALQSQNKLDGAVRHYRLLLRLRPDHIQALNNLAWILATHPDPNLRNPTEAVSLAEKAAQLSNHKDASILNTLAASYAAAERFSDAVKTAQSALNLATAENNSELISYIQNQLQLYKKQSSPSPR